MKFTSSYKRISILALSCCLALTSAPSTLMADDGSDHAPHIQDALASINESPSFGHSEAPVTIIVFTDYQCPFCKRAEETLKEIRARYGDDVRIVFKHYPLPFHKEAEHAARASIAAHRQGKFELLHHKLFEHADDFKADSIDDYLKTLAKFIGLDAAQFKKDYAATSTRDQIAQDMELAKELGVLGTPHFFVNGVRVLGAQPLAQFEKVIDPELKQSKALISKGKATGKTIHALRFAANYEEKEPEKKVKPAADKVVVEHVPIEKNDPVLGKSSALVTLVVFSDFQCPFCTRASKTIHELDDHYSSSELRIVFKHLPLPFHKEAEPAARAAFAAHQQGKFWAMHDLLFANQSDMKSGDSEFFISMANTLELDLKKFEKDMKSKQAKNKVDTDTKLAGELGARGTPNFFINGIQVTGARPTDTFKEVIDAQLIIAREMKKKTPSLKGDKLYSALIAHNKAEMKALPTPPKKERVEPPTTLTAAQLKTLRATKSTAVVGDRKTASVVIYEFTDLQCPFCQRAQRTMQELHELYGEDIAIVSFHFPLSFHKQAESAARAVVAAHQQGEGAAMRALIFSDIKALSTAADVSTLFVDYAKELGLNLKTFKKDYKAKSTANEVAANMKLGEELGVRGTPCFFVEEKRLVGAQPIEKFKDAIDEAKKK